MLSHSFRLLSHFLLLNNTIFLYIVRLLTLHHGSRSNEKCGIENCTYERLFPQAKEFFYGYLF